MVRWPVLDPRLRSAGLRRRAGRPLASTGAELAGQVLLVAAEQQAHVEVAVAVHAPSSTATKAPYPAYVQDLKAQTVADSSTASATLPIAVGAGLVTAVGATTAFALYRRRTRTRGMTASM